MENFKERKIEYLNKLIKNADMVNSITFKGTDEEEIKRNRSIFFDPQDENELDIAETIYSMLFDLYDLVQRASNGWVEKIPLEENKGIKLYIDIIKALNEGKDLNSLINNETDVAEILYSFIVGFVTKPEDTLTYMAEEIGIDVFDEDALTEMQEKISILNAKFQEKDMNLTSGSIIDNSENLEKAKQFAANFHNLCEEGKTEEHKLCLECDLYK